jgi:hypothetical protein
MNLCPKCSTPVQEESIEVEGQVIESEYWHDCVTPEMKLWRARDKARIIAESAASLRRALAFQAERDRIARVLGNPTDAEITQREKEKWDWIKSEWQRTGVKTLSET